MSRYLRLNVIKNRQRLGRTASCSKEYLSRPTCEEVFAPLFECGAHLFEHGRYVCLVVFFVGIRLTLLCNFQPQFVNNNDFLFELSLLFIIT